MTRAAWRAVMIILTAIVVSVTVSGPAPPGRDRVSVTAVAAGGWTNVTKPIAPPGVGGGMMAYDSKADVFVAFGGSDGDPTNGTWTLDPKTATWSLRQPAVSPPARVDGMFAYDAHADAFVLFGGWREPADEVYIRLGDTWVFYLGNDTWVPRQPAVSPPARSDAAVAYDVQDDVLLLFGGFNGTAYIGDTWQYSFNSDTWAAIANGVEPSVRADGRMAYDPTTRGFYLFGGNDYSGPNFTFHHLHDTWRYLPQTQTWTELAPSRSPGARDYAVFAADTASGQLLSLGGFGEGTVLGELWAFNTTEMGWRNLTAPGGPSPRMAAVGGYSPVENLFIVFSGGDKVSIKNDTWSYRFPGPLFGTITASSTRPDAGVSVAFHAEILGGSGAYAQPSWDFGDGTRAAIVDAPHAFAAPGSYTVRFQASDDMGDHLNVTIQVTVGGVLIWLEVAIIAAPAAVILAVVYWRVRRRTPRPPP